MLALRSHLSPLPKPLALAFAEAVFGTRLPLPVGLLFHLAWVVLASLAYVVAWRRALNLRNALILAAALWAATLLVFFPIAGWGVLGLAIGPRLMIPATVSHLLFAVILWGFCRIAFGRGNGPATA